MELPGEATTYNEAVTVAKQTPDSDLAIAAHLEDRRWSQLPAAADTLRAQAEEALQLRESAWSPLAAQLGGWVPLQRGCARA